MGGGHSSPPPPPPPGVPGPSNIGQWSNKGCWNDNPGSRAIPNNIANGQNITSCLNLAAQQGYNTAALQYGNQCWACNNCAYTKYGGQPPQATQCNINNPGGNTNMVYTRTTGAAGFNCNYANQKVPTIVDSNGIITAPNNYQVQANQGACIGWMNSTLYPGQFTCSNGAATSPQCKQLYKDLGLTTYSEMGFALDTNLNSEQIVGKQNGYSYTCASVDGENCLIGTNLNMQPLNPLKNITCETNTTPNKTPAQLCQKAFDYYNLYPSTNSIVIRGRNLKQNLNNNITNQNELNTLANTYSSYITNSNTAEGIQQGLNTILQETPVKLACCGRMSTTNNAPIQVSLKVPISPTVASENNTLKEFNYEKEVLTLPGESCPVDLTPGSSACNAFFGVYCENVVNQFQKQGLNPSLFSNYAPECACYAPKTEQQQFYPAGTPSQCYKDGCVPNTVSYLDPSSRGQTCSMTVCQNIVNTAGLSAGGNANISPTLQNNCGSYIPKNESKTGTTGSGSSSSSSSSSGSFDWSNYTLYIVICVIILIIIGYFSIKK